MVRPEPVSSLDRRAWTLAAAATAFGCLYFFVRQYFKDGVWRFDLTLVNKSLGVAALLLLALSMLLTARSYFSRRPGRALSLRKPYGLAGFWLGFVHGGVDHVILPAIGLHAEPKSVNLHAEAAGWAALALFAAMALISNERARKRIGSGTWRKVLRYAGYAGLSLAAAHAAFLKSASWSKYFRTFDSVLPSLSLFVFALAVAAIFLRLAVGFAERRKT
jgi:DMSO/TMAO reductase YedYZ heme-binding membrane subunit